ncbi:MAG: glycosyltransferase family 4 protein, partial [Actinobacteria bacterium]
MHETPRVLFLVHSEYPVGEPRVRRQADAALEAGWDVTVFALASEGSPVLEMVDGVRVVRSSIRRVRDMSAMGMVREYLGFELAALRFCAREPFADVVVVANPPDFLVGATIPQKLKGSRILLDVHDLMTDLFESRMGSSRNSLRMRVLSLLERWSWRFADQVLTVHAPYGDEILKRSGGRVSPLVVMNSADPKFFSKRTIGPPPPYTVGYHGSIMVRYGVTDLVEAFASLLEVDPDSRLALLGGGDGYPDVIAAARLAGVAHALDLSERMLPVETVVERIPEFHLGVVPNRPGGLNRFALSTKLLEYVATGVPVVCAGLETLRGHFDDDEVLFFEPGNPDDLAAKLVWARAHQVEMNARAEKAHMRYTRDYGWDANKLVFL